MRGHLRAQTLMRWRQKETEVAFKDPWYAVGALEIAVTLRLPWIRTKYKLKSWTKSATKRRAM